MSYAPIPDNEGSAPQPYVSAQGAYQPNAAPGPYDQQQPMHQHQHEQQQPMYGQQPQAGGPYQAQHQQPMYAQQPAGAPYQAGAPGAPPQPGVVVQGVQPPSGYLAYTPTGQAIVPFGPVPVNMQCAFCGYQGATTITKQEGSGHSTCCCLSCLGGGLIGVCIFYLACSEDYKDSVHRCARCGNVAGMYEKKAC